MTGSPYKSSHSEYIFYKSLQYDRTKIGVGHCRGHTSEDIGMVQNGDIEVEDFKKVVGGQ